jgi:hypothetical protein
MMMSVPHGMVPHNGSGCPIRGPACIKIMLHGGQVGWVSSLAKGWHWHPATLRFASDIIAYDPDHKGKSL